MICPAIMPGTVIRQTRTTLDSTVGALDDLEGNLIAPATMMQVLQYIAQHDNELNFITMLPLAGHDGSLQYRAGLHQAGVDGKVSAKTGSLQGVYNLAGFITTASGQRMAFVQYLSGYAVEPADQRNRRIPLVRFESRLYKDIYQNN